MDRSDIYQPNHHTDKKRLATFTERESAELNCPRSSPATAWRTTPKSADVEQFGHRVHGSLLSNVIAVRGAGAVEAVSTENLKAKVVSRASVFVFAQSVEKLRHRSDP